MGMMFCHVLIIRVLLFSPFCSGLLGSVGFPCRFEDMQLRPANNEAANTSDLPRISQIPTRSSSIARPGCVFEKCAPLEMAIGRP